MFYSFTKRFTSFSHLVLGFCLGIAPAAAWIAVRGSLDPRILWLTAAVTLWTAGFDIIYACQDYAFDVQTGLFSIPRRFGIARCSVDLARRCTSGCWCACCCWSALSRLGGLALAGVAAVAGLLLWEHRLVKADDLSRVDAAFFTMNGYVSVIFFLFWADGYFSSPVHLTMTPAISRCAPGADPRQSGSRRAPDADDGVTLYRSADILAWAGWRTWCASACTATAPIFNVNRHINPTDVCVASCRLCAFGKRVRDPKAYTMSLEEVWESAGHGYSEAVTEFHIVGGLHPELTLDWYCQMLRGLKERYPQVHLKAFTMVEIGYLAQRAKI